MAIDNKEKIDKIDEQIKQLKARKNSILAREREKERKARTRRLIQIGAIFDSIGINNTELAEKFKNEFDKNIELQNLLKK
jgi:ADP-dependent phosphofructokinase/glucokinase